MANFLENTLEPHFNFWIYVILMMIGLWAVIAKNNLIKKLIGLSIFQTAIILFYVSLGVKEGATIPIIQHSDHGEESHHGDVHGNAQTPDSDHADKNHAAEKHHDEKVPSNGHNKDPKYVEAHSNHHEIDPDTMANPLPHVLMLTAIVVGVATLGVALSLAQMVFKEFGTVEEDEVLEIIKGGESDD